MALEFNSPFLNHYMKMVEDTESPRLFHVWAAISGMSSCLGRRCWLPFGPMTVFANQYIALVGTPGTRKSTALGIMKRQLKKATGVRFAPADTAGQRQGLTEAMRGSDAAKEYLDSVEVSIADDSFAALTLGELAQISNIPPDPSETTESFVSAADKHHIMVVATELSRFIGQNNFQMLDFLTTMWDGDDYEYQTKGGLISLKNPLINILAATTPTSINHSLPPAAGGQGFLSRMILVYGSRKHKQVPRPSDPDPDSIDAVKSGFNRAYFELGGPFDETKEARDYCIGLYDFAPEITDPRFGYYFERRQDHLIKLAMALAASRASATIVKDDYEEAHKILRATERGMPDALGEFGMNPLAALKQSMLEYIRSHGMVPVDELRAVFHRDSRANEFMECVNDLGRMKQVSLTQLTNGQSVLMAKGGKSNSEDSMIKALME